jgi:hypothetical protein
MRTTIAALLLLAAPGDDPAARFTLYLTDGSRLIVSLPKEDLVFKTEFGEQRIPFSQLRFLRRVNDAEFAVSSPGVNATGEILAEELRFESPLGRMRIPLRELRAAAAGAGGSLILDERTVACWTFAEMSSGLCTDLVKNRPLTFKGMEVLPQPEGGAAAVRQNEQGHAEAAHDEELDVVKGDFTVEARFKTGTPPRGYAAVFSKNDRGNGQLCEFLLYVQNGGMLYFQSVSPRGSFSWNIPSTPIKPDEWAYVAVVVQPEKQRITFYVNGAQVHEVRQAFQFQSQGAPIFIGASPAYTGLGAPEKIQFVRLSRTARAAEEIADAQKAFQNLPVMGMPAGSRGLGLRDGAFLRADLPKLAGAVFRTRYGELRLDEKTAGEVSLYRFRPKEQAAVEAEVKALIDRLSDDGVAEREKARARLLEFAEAALPLLRKNASSSDAETRARIAGIVTKLEEKGVGARPATDVFRSGGLVLHGWLEQESIEAETRFGTFVVPVPSIDRVKLGDRPVAAPLLRLKSGEQILGEFPRGSAVEFDTGLGPLSIPVKEITALAMDPGGETWTVRTERLTAKGKLGVGELSVQTPAGRLKIPFDEIAEIPKRP